MTARPLRISSIAVAAIIGALAFVGAFLLWTAPGRALLKPMIASAIGDALGGEATIGALKGRLPGEVDLENVTLRTDGAEFLTIDKARLVWRPGAMIRKSVDIQSISIDGATLIALPQQRADKRERPRGLELPDRLPHVTIGALTFTNIRVAEGVAGAPLRLDGAGAAIMGGKRLDITLNATSSGERDFVSIRIVREEDALDAKVTVASKKDGAIAALARLGGDLYVEATGAGALADYKLAVSAELGAYGSLDGTLSGDLQRMNAVAFDMDARFGERLDGLVRVIGETAKAKGAFAPAENGGAVSIASLSSDLGEAKGVVSWRNRDKALQSVTIAAEAAFAKSWRPDLQRYLGGHMAIEGDITPKGDAFAVSARVDADLLDGELKDVETDLRTTARGPIKALLAANDEAPLVLRRGAQIEGEADIVFAKTVNATAATLTTREGAVFRGDADYDFKTRAFAAKGDLTATPAALAAVNEKLVAMKNASAVIDIKGVASDFAGKIVATTPALRYDRRNLPPARLALAFTNAPLIPAGSISARAIDGSGRIDAKFARYANGAWRANSIVYEGSGFALKGDASINPKSREIALNISYRGSKNAEPWPGVKIEGDLTARGSIARGASSNALELSAASVTLGGATLLGLAAKADGPAEALGVDARADSIAVKGVLPIIGVAAKMRASLGDAIAATLTAFSGDIGGAPIRLAAPARLTFGDGVSIDGLKASVGSGGSIAFDGAFSPYRWRGRASANGAPIAGAASIIDLSLDFDTNEQAPAAGAFTLTSLLSKADTARLSGAFDWNGKTLRVRDDDRESSFDLDLALPLRLVRTPRISIDAKGALAGKAHYEGRLETVAAFLPAALQSLEGGLQFDGTAGGTLADPILAGALTVSNGAYTELSSGLSVVNIDATARANGALSGSRIEFSGSGGGPGQVAKTVTAKGSLSLGKDARLASTVILNDARLSAGPIDSVIATGAVDISGAFDALTAAGELTIRELKAEVFTPELTGLVDIDVVAGGDGARPAAQGAVAARPIRLAYAIRIKGDDKIFVAGRGLNSEWRADARLAGRAAAPLFLGELSLKKGEIRFVGREFSMSRGAISFDTLSPNNPALDLRAERETRSGTTARIVIAGRARAPKITLESTPALPAEDIMALILFDKPASELSAIESLQVADGLAELGGIGPFGGQGVAGATRSALGLDVLSVDFDDADSAASTLTVGKYVADGLFVSATQDARGENGSVRIEYEIDDSFTVETELRQDGDQTVSANWKHDF